jgi:hypothetical protein
MHTTDGCTIAGSDQTAKLQTTNCFYKENFNSGCGSLLEEKTLPNNYGKPLNDNGGGVYATEWTTNYVKHWFFPRGSIPISISRGAPNVSDFGRPAVNQQGSCKLDEHFGNMSIIINTDFCGDWAGEVYAYYPNCPQNPAISSSRNRCVDFVGNNPQAFTEAYWDFNSIRVYQMPVGIVPTSSYSTSLSSSQAPASTNTVDAGMGRTSESLSSVSYTSPLSSLTSTPAVSSTSESEKETSTTSYELPDESGFFTDVSSTLSPVFSTPDTSTTRPELPDESGFFTQRSSTPSPVFSTPYPSASPGAGPGAACPGVDKQLVTAADGRTYRVYCSSETTGNGAFDSKIIAKGTYNQCFEYCTRELECTAFTWAEFNTNDGGECYFKKEVQTPRSGNSNLISVILVTGPSDNPPPTGSGSGSASTGATPSTSRAPSPTPRFNCVDGSLQTGPAGKAYTIFCNSETTGGAFASQLFPNGTYSQCIELCDATSGCGAWTWGPYSTTLDAGGNCFLKMGSQTRTPSDNPGSVGGSLFENSPSPLTTSSRITVVPPGPSASASSGSLTVPVLESPISSSSAKPSSTAVPCPAANGTEYVSSSGKVYEIICGVEQESDPSSSFYAMGDYSLCVAECEKELGCVSITYSKIGQGQGFCYFRKFVGRLVGTDDSDTHLNLLPGRFSSMNSPATASSSRSVASSSGMGISMSGSGGLSASSSGTSSITSSLSSASTSEDDDESTSTTSGKGSSSATASATIVSSTTISASSSSATGISSGVTAPFTTSLTSGTSSSASISRTSSASASALPPGNTPQCDQVFTDPSGVSYRILCSTDSSEGSFRTVPVYSGGYGSCFGACDNTQGCGGFTHVGEQSGNCYLKSRPGTFSSTTGNFVSAFKVDILGYSSTSNSRTVSSSMSSLTASSSTLTRSLSLSMSPGFTTSSTLMTGSGSSSSSASVSYAPLSPCPTSSSYYCMENNQQTTCAGSGNNYAIQCGIVYEGDEIDTSDINEMSSSSSPSSTAAVPSPSAVMIEVLPRTSSTAPAPSTTGSEESDESDTGGLSGPGPANPVDDSDESGTSGLSGPGPANPDDDSDDMSEM